MFEALKNDAAGLAILKEWLGDDGVPVGGVYATRRSEICLKCKEHRPAKWWEFAKNKVASAIKAHLSVKHLIGMMVENESQMGMCKACGCCTRLKIWVPLEHIEAHTSTETWLKLPMTCWIRQEAHK